MNNDILILGGGYIGQRLKEELDCPLSTARINTFDDVAAVIKKYNPKTIINCIGHTGVGNVDGCEKALDKTLQANTFVPLLLAEGAIRHNVKLIHISSGCIYHYDYKKSKPIDENLPPDYYELYYSRTKIYTEAVLQKLADNYDILVARIRVPLDNRPHSKNLLTKLLSFNKVIDVPNSVTYIPDFVKALHHLIKKNAKGIYNIALKDGLYYKDLLDRYNVQAPKKHDYEMIKLANLPLKRTNLILSTKKLEKSGFKVRTTKEILDECVREYRKHS